MQKTNEEALLAALRDFFLAANADALVTAYAALQAVAPEPAPAVDDWLPVEFAFNRLFVGPRTLLAPPYASVYLDPEPQLMGRITLQIRQLYQLLDLRVPWENVIPDDHLSFELDLCRQLSVARRTVVSPELEAIYMYLIAHMRRWVPQFVVRVRAARAVPPALGFVVEQLGRWLDTASLGVDSFPQLEWTGVIG
ncbi:MAG: molecular chaperone TorD family protein [Caldilineaceae bacterium]|nr:molecular chaperone TorD family protein [Caldilineaceae bacterium]